MLKVDATGFVNCTAAKAKVVFLLSVFSLGYYDASRLSSMQCRLCILNTHIRQLFAFSLLQAMRWLSSSCCCCCESADFNETKRPKTDRQTCLQNSVSSSLQMLSHTHVKRYNSQVSSCFFHTFTAFYPFVAFFYLIYAKP